jgi:hypothetical protein
VDHLRTRNGTRSTQTSAQIAPRSNIPRINHSSISLTSELKVISPLPVIHFT